MKMMIGVLLIVAATSAADFSPARRVSGSSPGLPPPNTIGWVEEAVELEVDLKGRVDHVALLTAASRGPSLVVPAVADWRFTPALDRGEPVASRVLVAAMFRPPTLYDNVLGINPAQTYLDYNGRPLYLLDNREKIAELV